MTSKTTNKFGPEVRARAVRMVLDHEGENIRLDGQQRRYCQVVGRGKRGADLVARSRCDSRAGYIAPRAEGPLPEGAVFGGLCEMTAKLEAGVSAAVGG